MFKLKICLASALVSVMLLTALPFYAYADNPEQNEQKADVSLVSEAIVQIEEQPVVYAASSGGQWIKESNGRWWYKHADGSYTKYNWEYIDGNWYFFDKNGWMWTDWLEWKGDWYYLDLSSGKMHTGWSNINGKRYYFSSKGVMQIGWVKINGADYYFDLNGAMCTGWIKVNNKWYYMNTDGSMRVGWIKLDGNWYYLNTDGSMRTGWFDLNGVWYYCNSNGVMLRGWQTIDGSRYYFASDGHMVTETFTQGKRTYTFFSSGKLNSTVMRLDRIEQGYTNWCWAAAIAMIGNYENGTNLTMQDIVISLRGNTDDKQTGAKKAEVLDEMRKILPNRGVQVMDEFKYDTFAWYVDKNHPVFTAITIYDDGNFGHAVVCSGYRRSDESLYFYDSSDDLNGKFVPYKDFFNHNIIDWVKGYNTLEYIIIYP